MAIGKVLVLTVVIACTPQVGSLTSDLRLVRVKNVLTAQEDLLEVPGEESLGEIRSRYLDLNAHAASYTWKALTRGCKGRD
jgi:hypothetical protein